MPSLRSSPGGTKLAERDVEVALLDDLVEGLRNGRSARLSIFGEPGVGRTALLQRLLGAARAAGMCAAYSRCSPFDADIPYAAALPLSAALHPPGRFADLVAACCTADRDAALSEMSGAFAELTEGAPLVLAIDDLQWADSWSLRWFDRLARRAHGYPVLLATAAYGPAGRDRGGDCPVHWPEIRVAPLGTAATTRMLHEAFGTDTGADFAAAAAGVTRGHPAVVHEVADRFAEAGLPADAERIPDLTGIARSVWSERAARMLCGLPAGPLELLRVLAMGGAERGFGMAGSLVDPGTDLQAALEQLVVAGLATGLPAPRLAGPYEAADVLGAMPAAEREELFFRAAVLEHRAGASSGRLADLLCGTGLVGQPWAGRALIESAAERARQGNATGAAEALRRALAEPMSAAEREAALLELARIEVAYAPEISDICLQLVLHESPCSPAAVTAADLLLGRGADAACATALMPGGAERAPRGRRAAMIALGRLAQEEAAAESDVPVAPPVPPVGPAQAGVLAWQLAARAADRERVRGLAAAALSARHDIPLMVRLAACRALLCCHDLDEAVAGLDALLADARRAAAGVVAAQALLYRALTAFRAGLPEAAADDLAAATAELPLRSWHPTLIPHLVAGRLGAEVRLGRLDRAGEIAAEPLPPGADAGVAWAFLLAAQGEVRLAAGDPAGALGPLRECGRILRSRHWHNPMLTPWRTLAGISLRLLGDRSAAEALFTEESALASRWGTGLVVQAFRDQVTARVGGAGAGSEARCRPATLSAAERDAAELAARGMANREIAAELSIAVRTVEMRLTKVYRKLGVGGRAELAGAWQAEA
ncbi:helix-turn-helix transcriptional regulator [Amycolatopsis jejuensis]|uniref:helix-turn-helix transcriptional regulator n=1 Tax=Amycolatopsis jejuensis TaxID=330084 RepID=UPI0009FCA94E|nr:LuxR family transcriptional regulator [Amycolatopsis jejuensis]